MRIRKSIAVLLLMCLLVPASYAQAFVISPMYVGIDVFQVSLSINGSGIAECNAYLSLRAAVRIYAAPGEYASSTFVYSWKSDAFHPYNPGYGNGGAYTYIAGRVDNRDSGTLDVSGTFHN